MALTGEKNYRGNNLGAENDDDDSQNLWASILSKVQSSSSSKLPSYKSLLVLGENESGKTSLNAKLQGTEETKKGSGLEYMYIDVKDDYRDDQTRLGVWILDGDLRHRGLLKFALTEDTFTDRVVLLTATMTEPWSILESLNNWAEVLSTHIDRLKITPKKRRQYEENMVRHFQEYIEPDENSQTVTSPPRRGAPNPLNPLGAKTDEDSVLLPLGETTLTRNLGIPIVVVITKSDAISTLEKEHDYREEHFDFIQQHIRKFCLNYGASLFYTSVKEEKNCELLYRYLVHRIYGFPFNTPAYVVEKDSVFIPSGWDNEKKISILYESMTSMKPDDPFEDVIVRPVTRKVMQRDAELTAEDEQLFLMRLQTMLSKQPAAGQRDSPLRPSSGVAKPTTPRAGISPIQNMSQGGSPKKPEGRGAAAAGSEGVLANFFNSLLSKGKPQTPGQPMNASTPMPTRPGAPVLSSSQMISRGGASVNRDAAVAELDRMHRAKKPTSTINNQNAPNNIS